MDTSPLRAALCRCVFACCCLVLAAAAAHPAAEVEVIESTPMHVPETVGYTLTGISPNGRYAVYEDRPEMGQVYTSIVTLGGTRVFVGLWVQTRFIRGGRALLLWNHLDVPPGLHLVPLPSGPRRQVFPRPGKQMPSTDFGWGLEWSEKRGEIAFVDDTTAKTQTIYAIRLRDGRLRRIIQGEQPLWSPNGRRLAFARAVRGEPSGAGPYTMWISDAQGRYARPIASGRPVGWLADSENILVDRESGYSRVRVGDPKAPSLALPTGKLSPSTRWLAVHRWPPDVRADDPKGDLRLVSTADGTSLAFPGNVLRFFWGEDDSEASVLRPEGWCRVHMRIPRP